MGQQKGKFGICFLKINILLIILLLTLACKNTDETTIGYTTFRSVPGITGEEIRAIEALQREFDYFIYGMPLSSEAFENEHGEIRGFTALFCEWLTELFGIPFVPRLYEWLDLLDGLQTKEISFSGELTASPARKEIYYMTNDIASRPLKYYRIAGSRPLADIARERPLRCGFIEGTNTIHTITAEMQSGTYEATLLSDVSLVHGALLSGQIDVFYYSGTAEANFVQYPDMETFSFFPLIYRPVSLTTQNSALQPIISVIDKILADSGIRYLIALYNQGEQEYLKYKLHRRLTREEIEFIQNNPVIQTGFDPGNYPVCFFDRRENEWRGIFVDKLNEVSAYTGLTFHRANDEFTEWPALYQMLLNGEVALLPELTQLPERERLFLWPETTMMIDNFALISKSDFPDIRVNEVLYTKVGLARDTSYSDIFRRWFPNHMNITEFESVDAAFEALQKGQVEMVMATQRRLLFLTHYLELPDFKSNIVFDQSIEIKSGFNRDHEILCSIMDKAFGIIDINTISDRWMRRTYDYRSKVAEAQRPWLLGSSVLLLFVIALLTILFMKNRREGIKLERLVLERTIRLNEYQKELESALETAKAANKSKSIFLANMSHEIRTPMNSIIGFSELAQDKETSVKTKDYLNKIQNNGKWLLQIINDILDISKIESGKMELEKIPFDMHELFSSCRTLVVPKAVEKGLFLHFYAEPSMGKKPVGDPTRLRQVLVNLLSNAIKFTNTGIVKLHAALTGMTERTITMSFEIKDSGIGMTPEQVEKIFDPFTQAESGTTRQYGGTGLGLSITKNIVEMMGGKLSVESALGVGSRFNFDLTFDTVDVAVDALSEKKAVLKEIEKPFFEGEILLCEDNAMNQQVICEHLARIGLSVVVAENGKIGVEMVKSRKEKGEKQFDLIFMDMYMPVMDGLEASTKILELNLNIPLIAMTANIMSSDREIYKKSGMQDCLGKPFTSQELWQCLLKYFKPLSPVKEVQPEEKVLPETDTVFKKSLQQFFAQNNQNKYEEIIKTLEAGDIKSAHRLAHTIKSNAGQLGKTALQQAAADVENQLKEGKNLATKSQLKIFETELNAVLAEFAPLLDESVKAEIQKPALETEKIMVLFEKLEPLLKSGNPDCLNFVEDLRAVPESGLLIQEMENFNFDSALSTLAKIRKTIIVEQST